MSSDKTTFYGDPDLKQALVDRLIWHQDQDAYIQGSYVIEPDLIIDVEGNYRAVENAGIARGCAMGCSMLAPGATRQDVKDLWEEKQRYPYDWSAFAGETFGLPEAFTDLEEMIFENVPPRVAHLWPLRLVQAIPAGVSHDELVAQIDAAEDAYEREAGLSAERRLGTCYFVRFAEHVWGYLRLLADPEDPHSNSVTVPRREPDTAPEEATKIAIGI